MPDNIPEPLAKAFSAEMAVPDQHGGGSSLSLLNLLQRTSDTAAGIELLALPALPETMVLPEMPEIILPKGVFIELQQTKEHE